MTIHHNCNDRKDKSVSQKFLTELSRNTLKNISQKLDKNKIEEQALASKLIQRNSSKIKGYQFLVSMLISSIDPEHTTLEKISGFFRDHFRVRISAQSLMGRLNDPNTVCFLKNIFESLLKNQFSEHLPSVPVELLAPFSKILIQDSTTCNLNQKLSAFFKGSGGRASKSSLKLDVVYDFKAKAFEHITLNQGSVADQALANKIIEHITPNTLIIRDLGYLRIDSVLKIIEAGGFFLSRMKNNMLVYLNENDTEQLDLADYLHKNFRKSKVVDIKVYITKEKAPVRLVAYKVPPEIAAERRRKARIKAKKEGRTLTQKSLTLLDFSLFITNVPVEIWPPEVIGTIYRIRWQIELLFKNWKSQLKIDCLSGINRFRIESLIYARLIYILLINVVYMLINYVGELIGREVSMRKVYIWLKCANRLRRVISGRLSWWEERNLDDIIATSMSQQKRKRKTTLQSIHEQDFYYGEAS
jgi:hypothetical protein